LAAALDLARLACGDWDRDRFWNWKGSAGAAAAFDVVLGGELMLVVADTGVAKEDDDDNVFELGVVALSGWSGVEGGGMRFAFRDVRSGEGVCGT
jgi:hypothetical protein